MKKFEKYAAYTVVEFVQDESFQQYVKQPSEEDGLFWDTFVEKYPGKAQEIEEAKTFLASLRFEERQPTPDQIEKMWKAISRETQKKGKKVLLKSVPKGWWAAAAVVLILIGSFTLLQYLGGEEKIYTGNGEFKEVNLSDGSVVTLSPNSQLTFKKNFQKNEKREVWLQGEAFFSVSQKYTVSHQYKPFLLHTKDLTIRVLGTTFNVNTRHDKTKVVLNTGKINVNFKDDNLKNLSLKPGEMLTYFEKDKEIKTDSVNTLPYISWKDKKFIFDNTSVKEIAQEIEDYYGYKVRIEGKVLSERKVTGTLSVPNAAKLINVLSTLLHINIEKKEDSLILKNYQ